MNENKFKIPEVTVDENGNATRKFTLNIKKNVNIDSVEEKAKELMTKSKSIMNNIIQDRLVDEDGWIYSFELSKKNPNYLLNIVCFNKDSELLIKYIQIVFILINEFIGKIDLIDGKSSSKYPYFLPKRVDYLPYIKELMDF